MYIAMFGNVCCDVAKHMRLRRMNMEEQHTGDDEERSSEEDRKKSEKACGI